MKVTHVIVDGSNIATEGRDAPSLAQLDAAVQAFVEEYGPSHVTVVVDATFPNRIDRKERKTYEEAVAANELITPPAGAIGRGDAFILQIAKRAGATILSNDSFQEFHGEYPWLFERGRLIGGKPVPHVGWVFMDRAPVRGPTSRRAVSEAKKVAKAVSQVADQVVAELAGDEVAEPPPRRRRSRAKAAEPVVADVAEVPGDGVAEPPPRRRRSRAKAAAPPPEPTTAPDGGEERSEVARVADDMATEGNGSRRGRAVEPYNEALPFIEFVGQHPVGSEVDATVERFSSHGAYVLVGSARGYVPLRNLAEPAPRSAKEIVRVGEQRRFVVVAIDPPRRGIDLALPGVVDVPVPDLADAADLVAELAVDVTDAAEEVARLADEAGSADEARPDAREAPARARKAAARTAAAKKTAAKKTAATSSAKKASTAKKTRAKKTAAKAAAAKKTTAKKTAAKKATAEKTPARTAPATKASTATVAAEPADDADGAAPAPRAGRDAAIASDPPGATTPRAAKRAPARTSGRTSAASAATTTGDTAGPSTGPSRKTAARRSTARTATSAPAAEGGAPEPTDRRPSEPAGDDATAAPASTSAKRPTRKASAAKAATTRKATTGARASARKAATAPDGAAPSPDDAVSAPAGS